MDNEMIDQVEEKLDEALATLAGGVPLNQVLDEMGSDVEWLRPMLELAIETGELRNDIPLPPPGASLERLLAYGESLGAAEAISAPARPGWRERLSNFFRDSFGHRLAVGITATSLFISLVVAFLAGSVAGGGLAVAAQDSLPGEALYPLKRTGETIYLTLTSDPQERENLVKTFNQRRRLETELLLEQGREAEVAFNGLVEAVTAETVKLDGLVAQLTPQTKIEGELDAGARIHLEGVTQPSGELVAWHITVLEPAPPPPAPAPSPALTPNPTVIPTEAPAATPSRVMSQATDTLKLEPSPAGTLEPPADEPSDAPSEEPAPPAEGNDEVETPAVDNQNQGDDNSGNDSLDNVPDDGFDDSVDNLNSGDTNSDDSNYRDLSSGDDNGGGGSSGGGSSGDGGGDNSDDSGNDDSGSDDSSS